MGFILKGLLFFVLLAILFFIIMKIANAATAVSIENVTININASQIVLNVSNNIYNLNNSPSVVLLQQNFTVFIDNILNSTNQTIVSNTTCSNASISLSCACPSVICPSIVSSNCSITSPVDLKNETKALFFDTYQTNLKQSIIDASNAATASIVFQLEPTKALIELYKEQAFNASIKQVDAERQRDQQVSTNLALTGELERTRNELKLLQIVALSFLVVGILTILGFYGYFEKKQGI